MANPIETAAKIVPDLYYDLIARVIPGAAALAALTFAAPTDSSLLYAVHEKHGLWFMLGGGYLLGFLLTGASALVFDVLLPFALRRISTSAANAVGGRGHYGPLDDVGKRDLDDGVRLWKMAAEKVCMQNLLIACGLVAYLAPSTPMGQQILQYLPLVAAGAAITWLHRVVTLKVRLATVVARS